MLVTQTVMTIEALFQQQNISTDYVFPRQQKSVAVAKKCDPLRLQVLRIFFEKNNSNFCG